MAKIASTAADNKLTTTATKSPTMNTTPVPTEPPPLPPEAIAEGDNSSHSEPDEDAAIKFEIMNTGVRGLRIVKIPELDTMELPFFAKEWGLRTGFRMIGTVRRIVDKLKEKGVIDKKRGASLKEQAEGSEESWTNRLDGLLAVVEESQTDVEEAICVSIYTDPECKKPITADTLAELGIGDVVVMLQAVWYVNMESGSLKKALAGINK